MLMIIIITAYHLYADNSNHETTAEVNTNDRLKFLGIEDAGFNCVKKRFLFILAVTLHFGHYLSVHFYC